MQASIKDATISVKQSPTFQGARKVYDHHHVAGILPSRLMELSPTTPDRPPDVRRTTCRKIVGN